MEIWSLLKRGLNGTYVSVEPFHLFRYVDDHAYRFNNRAVNDDFDRFRMALTPSWESASRTLT